MSIQYPAGTGFDPRMQRPKGQNVGQIGNIYIPQEEPQEQDNGIDAGDVIGTLAALAGAGALGLAGYGRVAGRNLWDRPNPATATAGAQKTYRREEPVVTPTNVNTSRVNREYDQGIVNQGSALLDEMLAQRNRGAKIHSKGQVNSERARIVDAFDRLATARERDASVSIEDLLADLRTNSSGTNVGSTGNLFRNLPGIKTGVSATSDELPTSEVISRMFGSSGRQPQGNYAEDFTNLNLGGEPAIQNLSLTDVQKVDANQILQSAPPEIPDTTLKKIETITAQDFLDNAVDGVQEVIGYSQETGQEPQPVFRTPRRAKGTQIFTDDLSERQGLAPQPIQAPRFSAPGDPNFARSIDLDDSVFAEASEAMRMKRAEEAEALAKLQLSKQERAQRRQALQEVIRKHVTSTSGHIPDAISTLGADDLDAAFEIIGDQLVTRPTLYLGSVAQGLVSYPEGLSDAQKAEYSRQLSTRRSVRELDPALQDHILKTSGKLITTYNNDYGRTLIQSALGNPDYTPAPKGQGFIADDPRRKTEVITMNPETGELTMSEPVASSKANNSDLSPLFKDIPGRIGSDIDIADSRGLDFSLKFDGSNKPEQGNQPGALLGYNTGFVDRVKELGDIRIGAGSGEETVVPLDEAYALGAGGSVLSGDINIKDDDISIKDRIQKLMNMARGTETLPEARVAYNTAEYGEASNKAAPGIVPTSFSLSDALVKGDIRLPSQSQMGSTKYDDRGSFIYIPSRVYGKDIESLLAAALPKARIASEGLTPQGTKIRLGQSNPHLSVERNRKARDIGLGALVSAVKTQGNLNDELNGLDGIEFLAKMAEMGDAAFTADPTELQKRAIEITLSRQSETGSLLPELQKIAQLGGNLAEVDKGVRAAQIKIGDELTSPFLDPKPGWEEARDMISAGTRRYGQPTLLKYNQDLFDLQPDPQQAKDEFIGALQLTGTSKYRKALDKGQGPKDIIRAMAERAWPGLDASEYEQIANKRMNPYGSLNPVVYIADKPGASNKYLRASILNDRTWKDLVANYKGGAAAAEKLQGVPVVVQLSEHHAQPTQMQVPVTRGMSDAIETLLKMENLDNPIPFDTDNIEGMTEALLNTPSKGRRSVIGRPAVTLATANETNSSKARVPLKKLVKRQGVLQEPEYSTFDATRELENVKEGAKSYGDALALGARLRSEAEEQAITRRYEKDIEKIDKRMGDIEARLPGLPSNQAKLLKKEQESLIDQMQTLKSEYESNLEGLSRSRSTAVSPSVAKDPSARLQNYKDLAVEFGFNDDEIQQMLANNELESAVDAAYRTQAIHEAPSVNNDFAELSIRTNTAARQRARQMLAEGKSQLEVDSYLQKISQGLEESKRRNRELEQQSILRNSQARTTYAVNPKSIDITDLENLPYGSKVTRNVDGTVDKVIVPAVGGTTDRDRSAAYRKYGSNTYGIQMEPKDYLDYNVPAEIIHLGDYAVQDSYETTRVAPSLLQAVETYGAMKQGDESAKFLKRLGTTSSYLNSLSSLQKIREAERVKRSPNPVRDKELVLKARHFDEAEGISRDKILAEVESMNAAQIRSEADKIRNRLLIGPDLPGTENISDALEAMKNPRVAPLIRFGGTNVIPITRAGIEATTLTEGGTKKSGLLKEFSIPYDKTAALDRGIEVSWKDRQNQDYPQRGSVQSSDPRRTLLQMVGGKGSAGQNISIDTSAPIRHQLGQLLAQDPDNLTFFQPRVPGQKPKLNDVGKSLIAADEGRGRNYESIDNQTKARVELDPQLHDKVYPGDRPMPLRPGGAPSVPNLYADDPSQGSQKSLQDYLAQLREERLSQQSPSVQRLSLAAAFEKAADQLPAASKQQQARTAGKQSRRMAEGNTDVAIGGYNSAGTYVEWDEKKNGFVPVAGVASPLVSLSKRQVRDIQQPGGIFREKVRQVGKDQAMNRRGLILQARADQQDSGGRLTAMNNLGMSESDIIRNFGMTSDQLVARANAELQRTKLPRSQNSVYLAGPGPSSNLLPETIGDLDLSSYSPLLLNGHDTSRVYYPHGRNLGSKAPQISAQGSVNLDSSLDSEIFRAIGLGDAKPGEVKQMLTSGPWTPRKPPVGLQSNNAKARTPQMNTSAPPISRVLNPNTPDLPSRMAGQRRTGQTIQRLLQHPRQTVNGIVITDLNS